MKRAGQQSKGARVWVEKGRQVRRQVRARQTTAVPFKKIRGVKNRAGCRRQTRPPGEPHSLPQARNPTKRWRLAPCPANTPHRHGIPTTTKKYPFRIRVGAQKKKDFDLCSYFCTSSSSLLTAVSQPPSYTRGSCDCARPILDECVACGLVGLARR